MALLLSIISMVLLVTSIIQFIGRKKKNIPFKVPVLLLVGAIVLFVISTEMSNREIKQAEKEELERYRIEKELEETNKAEKDEAVTEEVDKEEGTNLIVQKPNRKEEIEKIIKKRFDDGDYKNVKLDRITINENLGTDNPDDYVALVYFKFDIRNKKETGNNLMGMYSDDLVATLAKQGITDISEAAIFWEDDYNNRKLKYAYEYRNEGFYITDKVE